MENLSLHILDIVENSVRAGAKRVTIELVENEARDTLRICVRDDGRGMSAETIKRALDPFFTTKKGKKVGLGLSLFAQAARETGGRLTVQSKSGAGATVKAVFRPSHPDMKPMGDMPETLAVLIAGYPDVRFTYRHRKAGECCEFDSHGAILKRTDTTRMNRRFNMKQRTTDR